MFMTFSEHILNVSDERYVKLTRASNSSRFGDEGVCKSAGLTIDHFTTIDWLLDLESERKFKRLRLRSDTWALKFKSLFVTWEAWIILFCVGIATGTLAAVMGICTEWLSNLKEGYCISDFFSNRKFCCLNKGFAWLISRELL